MSKTDPLAPNLFDHPRREEMILRLARLFKLSEATTYSALSEPIKDLWSAYPYYMVLRPLVLYDRKREQMSYAQIAIRYDLTERQVRYLVTGK